MKSHHSALLQFHDRLRDSGVTWALTASLNLAVRGSDIEPNDIDVMTNASGADAIESVFSEHVIRPVSHSRSHETRIESHFGVIELDDTEIEIMGEVRYLVAREWTEPVDVAARREFVDFEDRMIPAMSLEHELTGYRNLGREKRVKQVETLL
jgi:hypothetical protein